MLQGNVAIKKVLHIKCCSCVFMYQSSNGSQTLGFVAILCANMTVDNITT